MDSESNVIPFVLRTDRQIADPSKLVPELIGYEVISPKELIHSHPGAAMALFDSARESYHMAMQTLGFLEEGFKEYSASTVCANEDSKADGSYGAEDINKYFTDFSEPHTAEIIDAKDPAIWKNKTNNNISP